MTNSVAFVIRMLGLQFPDEFLQPLVDLERILGFVDKVFHLVGVGGNDCSSISVTLLVIG